MQKQLDMEILIKKCFDSAEKYIQKMRTLYVDKMDLVLFDREMPKFAELRKVAESLPNTTNWNDRYMMVQKLKGMYVDAGLFMKPNSPDNSTYIAFSRLIYGLAGYYEVRSDKSREEFLERYKSWCYKISSNRLKDFIYPLVPASYIVERVQKAR
ncbi:MAG: hypothetical protein ACLRFI_01445 [Alphaproteobacteria bacterium]